MNGSAKTQYGFLGFITLHYPLQFVLLVVYSVIENRIFKCDVLFWIQEHFKTGLRLNYIVCPCIIIISILCIIMDYSAE